MKKLYFLFVAFVLVQVGFGTDSNVFSLNTTDGLHVIQSFDSIERVCDGEYGRYGKKAYFLPAQTTPLALRFKVVPGQQGIKKFAYFLNGVQQGAITENNIFTLPLNGRQVGDKLSVRGYDAQGRATPEFRANFDVIPTIPSCVSGMRLSDWKVRYRYYESTQALLSKKVGARGDDYFPTVDDDGKGILEFNTGFAWDCDYTSDGVLAARVNLPRKGKEWTTATKPKRDRKGRFAPGRSKVSGITLDFGASGAFRSQWDERLNEFILDSYIASLSVNLGADRIFRMPPPWSAFFLAGELNLSGKATGERTTAQDSVQWTFEAEPSLAITFGVGMEDIIVPAAVKGTGSVPFKYKDGLEQVKLKGEFSLEAEVFVWKASLKLLQAELEIYPNYGGKKGLKGTTYAKKLSINDFTPITESCRPAKCYPYPMRPKARPKADAGDSFVVMTDVPRQVYSELIEQGGDIVFIATQDDAVQDRMNSSALSVITQKENDSLHSSRIPSDGLNAYEPHLAKFGGNGSVCAWLQASRSWSETDEPSELLKTLNVMASVSGNGVETGAVQQISTEGAFNRHIAVAGSSNGVAVVAWVRNRGSLFASADDEDQIVAAFYQGGKWSAEETVVEHAGCVGKLDVIWDAGRTVLAYSTDITFDDESRTNSEIKVVENDAGTWSDVRSITQDDKDDESPFLSKGEDGKIWLCWLSGRSIYSSVYPFETNECIFEQDEINLGGILPVEDGNGCLKGLTFLGNSFAEGQGDGLELNVMAFNGTGTNGWTRPVALTANNETEQFPRAIVDRKGNYRFFYLTQPPCTSTNDFTRYATMKEVVYSPRLDLAAVSIAFPEGDLQVGSNVMVMAGISNCGLVTEGTNYAVNLYRGTDLVGSSRVNTIPNVGETMEVEIPYTLTMETNTIFTVKIDEAGVLGEANTNNNVFACSLMGTDLFVKNMDIVRMTDGWVATAEIGNDGLVSSPDGVHVEFRKDSVDGALLGSDTIGSVEFGTNMTYCASIVIPTTVQTTSEWTSVYAIVNPSSNEVAEVSYLNNVGTAQLVSLTDSDGDGLPDKYELEHGTDPHNPDTDGDGVSDFDEICKWGTSPTNTSYKIVFDSGEAKAFPGGRKETYVILDKGDTVVLPELGNTPRFRFKGWEEDVSPVTGDATYHAKFEERAIWVDAENGNDLTGDGESEGSAFQSIQRAFEATTNGCYSIKVKPGVYAGFESWGSDSTSNTGIVIRAIEGAEKTIIDGGMLFGSSNWSEENDNLERETFEGFTLRNLRYIGGLNLISCLITKVEEVGESYLENCFITKNTYGIYCSKVVGCTVVGNKGGVYGDSVDSGSIVLNSIVVDNADPVWGTEEYNEFVKFEHSLTSPLPTLGVGNRTGDPLFVDAANGDFRLRGNSPCIDAGSAANLTRTTDYRGNERSQNAAPDLGAIEGAVEGLVVSLRVDGAGEAQCDGCCTKVVQSGESATIEAVETVRTFLYWQIGDEQISNKVWTIANITTDIVATAVFEHREHHVEGGDLQFAVDVSVDGDTIYVHPGTYAPISVTNKSISIISTDGAETTVIDGGDTNRCATLGADAGEGATLVGFTLINGYLADSGSDDELTGGGVYGGRVYDSVITNCAACWGGGGAEACLLERCLIVGNRIQYGCGGGAEYCRLTNCRVLNNRIAPGENQSGGEGGGLHYCWAENCLIADNKIRCRNESDQTVYGGGAAASKLYGCTVVNNALEVELSAGETNLLSECYGAGLAENQCLVNTISYGNTLNGIVDDANSFRYNEVEQSSCWIGEDPKFVDYANGDYRLAEDSPCINRGDNAFVTTDRDLSGSPRIQKGVVDIGCYESEYEETVPTLYVNAAATGKGDGSSLEDGFTSLMDACNAAEVGTVILVAPGTYTLGTFVGESVAFKSLEGAAKTVIEDSYLSGGLVWSVSNDDLDRVTFEGFTFRKCRTITCVNLIACFITEGQDISYSYLENCIVTKNKGGIDYCKLVGCTVYGNRSGISGWISEWRDCRASVILNSIVVGQKYLNYQGTDVSFDYSLTMPLPSDGNGNLRDDPLFVDAENGDFRLRAGSPCIDAGCVTNTARTTDYFGNPRCLGANPDMGAIEGAVDGFVVSLRVDGTGEAQCDGSRTKVVQSGESATIEAVETVRTFLYWQIGDAQISNKVWTITNITTDIVATAVFERVDHHVSNGDSLQAAIDAAVDWETIYVGPGTYQPIDTGDKNLRVISTEGAAVTIIDGGNTNRCAYLGEDQDGYSELYGFTMVNGFSKSGAGIVGGLVCDSVISNCTAYTYGGGAGNSMVYRSLIVNNRILEEEGGITSVLSGGGAYRCHLYDCQVLDNVILATNNCGQVYGAGVSGGFAEGCLIARNRLVCANSDEVDAYGGGAYESEIYSCTIVDNALEVSLAAGETNVVRSCSGAGVFNSYGLVNSISYGNKLNGIADDADESFDDEEMLATCIIGTDPGFVDYANGDFRLTETSPAIDRGLDSESTIPVDLDGNPRISGKAIDAGAYEYQWTHLWCSTTNLVLSGAVQTNKVIFGGSSDYQLSASDDWIELIGTTGVFAVAANTTGAAREGSIVLRGTSEEFVVRIFQGARTIPPTGTYHGLFVGINEYASGISSLDGCVADATNMQNQCVKYGYWRRGKTQTLLNGDATKAALRAALRSLAAMAQVGDTVLYYHSGHGGNHTDTSGNFTDDVYLCATDANYEDYELADDLALFKSGVRVVIVIDACHSGGMFKAKGGSAALPAKWNLAERVQRLLERKRRVALLSGAKNVASSAAEIGWMTACAANEYSWDSSSGGEFTSWLLDGWAWRADAREEGGDGDGFVNFLELAKCAEKNITDMTVQHLNDELLVSTIAGVSEETISSGGLEEALGAGDFINWSGDWDVQMTDTVDGLAAQSSKIKDAETAILYGDVHGSGILSFKWRVSSEEGKDYLRFSLDDKGLCAISGETEWADVTVNVSGDEWHSLVWTYAKSKSGTAGEDCGRVDCVVWTPIATDEPTEIPLGEALGARDIAWKTDGAAQWRGFKRGLETYAQTSPLADDQSAALSTKLVGPGRLTFEWRVSSEENYDMLNFSVNGEVKRYISGDTEWAQVCLDLADGTNEVAWVYAKDESGAGGEDCAYLRKVVWTGAALPVATETTTTPVPVPYSWLDQHAEILSAAGGDYESAAKAMGANGCAVWESFVAGLTPEDASSHFVSTIRFVDGKPVIEWMPALNGVGVREGVRRYTVYGIKHLGEVWQIVPEGEEAAFNFFKVTVELP